jgi:hypothetical protein
MREFTGYNIKTVPQMGWTGIKNGQLLGLASQEFDIFITVDKNLPFEQNLPQFNLAIIILQSQSNRLVPKVLEVLATVTKGTATVVSL